MNEHSPTIHFPTDSLTPDEMYLLLRDAVMPRPVAWVSTINAQGQTNLAPYSFFTVVSPHPPVLGISVGPKGEARGHESYEKKDTLKNIELNREFVINVVPEGLMEQMIRSSDPLPYGESEFAHAGLREAASTIVKPPRVEGAPVAYECTLFDMIEIGESHWVMGHVRYAHVNESVYAGEKDGMRHRVDVLRHEAMRPVGRLGRANYLRLREIETHIRKDGG